MEITQIITILRTICVWFHIHEQVVYLESSRFHCFLFNRLPTGKNGHLDGRTVGPS